MGAQYVQGGGASRRVPYISQVLPHAQRPFPFTAVEAPEDGRSFRTIRTPGSNKARCLSRIGGIG